MRFSTKSWHYRFYMLWRMDKQHPSNTCQYIGGIIGNLFGIIILLSIIPLLYFSLHISYDQPFGVEWGLVMMGWFIIPCCIIVLWVNNISSFLYKHFCSPINWD